MACEVRLNIDATDLSAGADWLDKPRGVRATAKNQLSQLVGGRKDYKIDALAADLPPEFGNWNVFT